MVHAGCQAGAFYQLTGLLLPVSKMRSDHIMDLQVPSHAGNLHEGRVAMKLQLKGKAFLKIFKRYSIRRIKAGMSLPFKLPSVGKKNKKK